MIDRPVPPEMETGELAVHIVSDGGEHDHVLVLARDAGGVRVREWTGGNWAKGPSENVVSAGALIARLEGIVAKRKRVDPDVRTVRSWIAGTAR